MRAYSSRWAHLNFRRLKKVRRRRNKGQPAEASWRETALLPAFRQLYCTCNEWGRPYRRKTFLWRCCCEAAFFFIPFGLLFLLLLLPLFSILPYNTLMLNMRGKKTLVSFPSDSRNPPVSYFFILDHIIFRRRKNKEIRNIRRKKKKKKNENSLNVRNPTVQSTSPSLSFSAFVNALSL